jgi:hypothetical protein
MWARTNAAYSPSRAERRIESEADDKFSKEQAHQVRVAWREFRARVEAEFHPSRERADAISSHLDCLSEAVGRLSTFDWRAVAVSTVMSIAVNLTVDTEGRTLVTVSESEPGALPNAGAKLQASPNRDRE